MDYTYLFSNFTSFNVRFANPGHETGGHISIGATSKSNRRNNGKSDETDLPYSCEPNCKSCYKSAYIVQYLPYLQLTYTFPIPSILQHLMI